MNILDNRPICGLIGAILLTFASTLAIIGGNILDWWHVSVWLPLALFLLIGGVVAAVSASLLIIASLWLRSGKPAVDTSKVYTLTEEQIKRITDEIARRQDSLNKK